MYEDIPTYDDVEYEYEDFYEDDNLYWEGEDTYSPLLQTISLSQLTTACIIPTLIDSHSEAFMDSHILYHNGPGGTAFICRLQNDLRDDFVLFVKTTNVKYGPLCAIITVFEVFVVESKEWHIIRGIQMIIVMKVISLGFDLDCGITPRLPSMIEFFGYCLCPGSLIFGPWHSYKQYLSFFTKLQLFGTGTLLLRIIISGIVGIAFLLLSTCFMQWLVHDLENKWFVAYRDALSFRSSHYFISFISELTVLILAVESFQMNVKCFVSQPHKIEFPRSLTDVVIAWNIPMHYWLKTYVFKVIKPLNTFAGIFSTYAASSLLHGLNFQLAAVLLSLGFYTYVEFIFRRKLALVFNACILTRKCRNDCSHHYKQYHPLVILTNLGFLFLTVFHLAYLGVMFDDNSSLQDEGYNMNHTLSKWSNLNFTSHSIVLGMYTIYLLI
uniref:Protein-serine O-palmitoleoyltransferase porcupine n=1 Tax=Strigamia maritima TaxID=126957 RepID=T1JL91_STRMM